MREIVANDAIPLGSECYAGVNDNSDSWYFLDVSGRRNARHDIAIQGLTAILILPMRSFVPDPPSYILENAGSSLEPFGILVLIFSILVEGSESAVGIGRYYSVTRRIGLGVIAF
jgi:hypothetical protein